MTNGEAGTTSQSTRHTRGKGTPMSNAALNEPHRQWTNRPADQRYESLADLYSAVHARRMVARQSDVRAHDLHFLPVNGGIEVKAGTDDLCPTNWAFGQLCTRLSAPAGYLRTLPAPIAADALNHGASNQNGDQVKLLSLDGDNVTMLSAATSATYGRIWDADVVHAVQQIQSAHPEFDNPLEWGGRKSGLYASDRDVFMFLVDGGSIVNGGGERDQLHRGFYVWNSEVGSATMGICTFLFRMVCGNHLIWGGQDVKVVKIRHTSGGPERFVSEAIPALAEYVQASAAPMEATVRRAKAYQLPDYSDATKVAAWLQGKGFSRAESGRAVDFATREEGQCVSLWDAINGLTASARSLAYVDARVDLEKRAGALLSLVAE